MSDPGGGQFRAGPPSAVDAALAALAASSTVAWHRPVRTRRTWLDSIDLRLYRNRMALTAVEGPDGSGCMLTLSRTDGATVEPLPRRPNRPTPASPSKELKALQDVLGTFQDSQAQRDALCSFATDMITGDSASARTLFATGEMAARLQGDQEAARAQFAVTFSRFSRRSARRRTTPPAPRRSAQANATAGAVR